MMSVRNWIADFIKRHERRIPKWAQWQWIWSLRCWLRSGTTSYNYVLVAYGIPGATIPKKTFFDEHFGGSFYSIHVAVIGADGSAEVFCRDGRLWPPEHFNCRCVYVPEEI